MTRKLGILILSSLAAAASHPAPAATPNLARQAESQSAKPAAPAKEMRVAPEPRKLSPEVIAQHQKLQRLLPAETKLRIDRLVPDFKKQVLHAKPGDAVSAGDAVVELHYRDATRLAAALPLATRSLEVGDTPVAMRALIAGDVR